MSGYVVLAISTKEIDDVNVYSASNTWVRVQQGMAHDAKVMTPEMAISLHNDARKNTINKNYEFVIMHVNQEKG